MIVYKTTNSVNGKIYVGKDCNNNPNYLGSGKIIKQAIRKYGKSNFKKEVLEVCDLSNIDDRERYWIAHLEARNPNVGYNINVGGDGGGFGADSPRFGKHNSRSARLRVSLARKGIKFTEEHKKRLSSAKIGLKFSDDHKRKQSKALRRYWLRNRRVNPEFRKHIAKEQKQLLSKINSGRRWSKAAKKRLSDAMKKRVMTMAHRRHLSDALRGHVVSEKSKLKMSLAKIGRVFSLETRIRMARAQRRRQRALRLLQKRAA